MTRFITDGRIAPDNNVSERALRVVALGRRTFLFVGSKEAGENLAALYTVVATCLTSGVDPLAYLSDVLIRVAPRRPRTSTGFCLGTGYRLRANASTAQAGRIH